MTEKNLNGELLRFLNRNYLSTSHLMERLDEIKELEVFAKAEKVIGSTIGLLQLQLKKLDHLYTSIGETYSFIGYSNLIGWLEELFTNIHNENNNPYLGLLDYISAADMLRAQSAQMAELTLDRFYDLGLPEKFTYDTAIVQPLIFLLENEAKVN